MDRIIKKPYSMLDIDKARVELEFLVTKCFISGYNTRLCSILYSAEGFFRSPEEEEEICCVLEKCLRDGGNTTTVQRRTPQDYRRLAEVSYKVLKENYLKLPWEELICLDNIPRKQIYASLVSSKVKIDEIAGLLSIVFSDSVNALAEYERLKQKIKTLAKLGNEFERELCTLKKEIRDNSGQDPVYKVSFEIHEGYRSGAEF